MIGVIAVSLVSVLLLFSLGCGSEVPSRPTVQPTDTPQLTPTPVPTVWDPLIQARRSPECLEVLSIGYEANERRPPKLVGEIINNCAFSFSSVQVTVVLMKSIVDLQIGVEERGIGPLRPGETGSFGASWRNRSGSDRPRALEGAWDTVIVGFQGVDQSTGQPKIDGFFTKVDKKGTVTMVNNNERVIGSIVIFRTGYDANGMAIASDFTNPLTIELEPGKTKSFSLNPSSNRLGTSTTFNYYVDVGKPVFWTVSATGKIREP